MRSVPIVALVLTFGACGGSGLPPTPRDAVPDGRPEGDAEEALVRRIYEYGLGFGETRAAIAESLGKPTRIDTALAENRHVPIATDSLFTLVYDGLEFELNRPGPVARELLIAVTLTDRTRTLPGGVGIGTPRPDLERLLGFPHDAESAGEGTVLVYRVSGAEAGQFVEFVVRTDTVRTVRWLPYVD